MWQIRNIEAPPLRAYAAAEELLAAACLLQGTEYDVEAGGGGPAKAGGEVNFGGGTDTKTTAAVSDTETEDGEERWFFTARELAAGEDSPRAGCPNFQIFDEEDEIQAEGPGADLQYCW